MRVLKTYAALAAAALLIANSSAARAQSTAMPLTPAATSTAPAPSPEVQARLAAILERGSRQPAKPRAEAEAKVQEAVNEVNAKAVSEGNDKVGQRLASEFGVTPQAITAEKAATGLSWGDLMMAHTLLANAARDLTLDQLDWMKKDGKGWSQIAAGMGFKLSDVVAAARAESKVGTGAAKARGKVHPIGHGTLRDENRAADPNPKARAILPESIAKTDTADTSQTDKP